MTVFRDKALLHQLRLCRADMVTAIGESDLPPHPTTLKELAELQLIIMATEQAIKDKQDHSFLRSFESQDAAA
jgi:hypothetical protein